MTYFTCFFLDNEKDIIVSLYKNLDKLFFVLKTPNHGSGNLIRNLAKACHQKLSQDEDGKFIGDVVYDISQPLPERIVGVKVAAENFYPVEQHFYGKTRTRVAAKIIFAAVPVRDGNNLHAVEFHRRGAVLAGQAAFAVLEPVHGRREHAELHNKFTLLSRA